MNLRRHDLVDVDPGAWDVADLDLPPEAARVVADWSRRGRPVIVRRRLVGEPADEVPVALQLPNACGRLRVALCLPETGVTPRARVGLAEAADAAPMHWRDAIAALLELEDAGGMPSVYGGLMWQYVTGETVLRASSDLDLLWTPMPAHRKALVKALSHLDDGDVRIDGEIEIDDGAVAWRELRSAIAGNAPTVLVKTIHGIELRDAAEVLESGLVTC